MNLNSELFKDGLVKYMVKRGGALRPLVFNWDRSKGTSLCNPSFYNDRGELKVIVRCVNYTLHHSEKNLFPHWAGPLQYIHPENDVRLATENYLAELDDDLNITKVRFIDMRLNKKSVWGFHGLEDARLIRWNDHLYMTGVRRDVKEDGQGRMELSEIDESDLNVVIELNRTRIPTTGDDTAYCEKNWMPVIDRPYTYVKWSNPTEIVYWDHEGSRKLSSIVTSRLPGHQEVRGGTHAVPYKGYYIAIGHSVKLWRPYSGEKDSCYDAHIIVWDSNFKLLYVSDGFKFMNAMIEFCCGMDLDNQGNLVVSFAEMDNEAYLLRFDGDIILDELGLKY